MWQTPPIWSLAIAMTSSPNQLLPSSRGSHRRAKRSARREPREQLPLLVREKFAVICHDDAITLGIFDFRNVHFEVDGTHDAIAEHLVDERLDGSTIDLGDLVEPVDERVDGHGAVE